MRRLGLVLVIIGCLLAPAAVAGLWITTELADTDRYVRQIAFLAHDPDVQENAAERVADAVLRELGDPGDAMAEQVRVAAASIARSDLFPALWSGDNRAAHDAVQDGLNGRADPADLFVRVEAGPFADEIATRTGIALGNPTFSLMRTDTLERLRPAYDWSMRLRWVLPGLALALLAAGIALGGRAALLWTGAGLVGGMLFLLLVQAFARGRFIERAAVYGFSGPAAADAIDALSAPLTVAAWGLVGLGLALILAIFVTDRHAPRPRRSAGARFRS